MKKVLCLVTVVAIAVLSLVGCTSKESYLGTYVYDHTTVSTTDPLVKELVEEAGDAAFEDGTVYLEENGVAYYGVGFKDVKHSYIVSGDKIIFTDCDVEYVYDGNYLIIKMDDTDAPMSVFFKKQ